MSEKNKIKGAISRYENFFSVFIRIVLKVKYNINVIARIDEILNDKYEISKLNKLGQRRNKAFKIPDVSPSNS